MRLVAGEVGDDVPSSFSSMANKPRATARITIDRTITTGLYGIIGTERLRVDACRLYSERLGQSLTWINRTRAADAFDGPLTRTRYPGRVQREGDVMVCPHCGANAERLPVIAGDRRDIRCPTCGVYSISGTQADRFDNGRGDPKAAGFVVDVSDAVG
jgi:hypothetical protein